MRRRLLAIVLLFLHFCSAAVRKPLKRVSGIAGWYGGKFIGRTTASGQKYDPEQLTAASRTYPFGKQLKVTYLKTRKSVIVRINDRGPWVGNRILDLSPRAAELIGLKRPGIGLVEIEEVN
jgi:rare lipoprotein A